jgi:hypothetical protein
MYNRKIMENDQPDDWLKNLPVQTENIAYKADEMIDCAKCNRSNPPSRLNCFYCGDELPAKDVQSKFIKPNLRKLESWEKGFNVILTPNRQIFDETRLTEIASLLKLDKEILEKLIQANNPLPLARVESPREAEVIKARLDEIAIETLVLSDESLAVEKPPRRLRGIEFNDEKLILILFNQDSPLEIRSDDFALIVNGLVRERKISATEKYNKKGENKILDTTETLSDESLIDVYSRQDSTGFRIYSKGFDFSCLEAAKEILAKDNIKKLAVKLREVAPKAKCVDDYASSRTVLANIWEVEQRTDSQGLKREGFGKFNLGNVTTVSNLSQFTKYSRLQWHLL